MDQRFIDALAGRYRIEREIGAGGMATVYLAHDLKHDRAIALKVLRPGLDPRVGRERFDREIRLAARLQHPHILTVLDSGTVEGKAGGSRLLFYSMPYVDGETLRGRIAREGRLPIRDALRIAHQAAQALQYAHGQGVIHRDIKPENILLTRDGNTLVTDFGIARAQDDALAPSLTRSGVMLGTPAYMSPEQSSGDEEVDARTDIYSLGVVLFEMLAGTPPFTGTTGQDVMLKRLSAAPPSVRALRPGVPATLDASLREALAPMPGDRTPSAAALVTALDRAARSLTDPGTAVPGPGHRRLTVRNVAMMALAALALVLAASPRARRALTALTAPSASPAPPVRIAVLPFENLGDSADAYFADGVTDAIRGQLASIPALQVIARGSSVPYAGSDKAPAMVASELGVRYLLAGTVRWARNPDGTSRVLVRPELVEVAEDGTAATRWQQAFDAPLTDVFKVQGDIAGSVTRALSVALPGSVQVHLADAPTRNPDAYDAYLRGLAAHAGGTATAAPAMRNAGAYYDEAVRLDSTFTAAWGGVALTSMVLYANSVPTPELADRARVALDRVAALDPDGIDTHILRSRYYALVKEDGERALAELERVLPRAPHNAFLLNALSNAERSTGRWDEALDHARRALELDPRNPSRASAVSLIYLWMRRPADAAPFADRAIALAPDNPAFVQRRAMVSLAQGDLPAARAVLAAATGIPRADMAAYMANIWDLGWVLAPADQRLVLTLGVGAFDGDGFSRAMARSQLFAWAGDSARMRSWADTAARYLTDQLGETPDDAQRLVLRGFMRARSGHEREARSDTERGLAISRRKPDTFVHPFYEHTAARTFLQLGDTDRAIALLEDLMRQPYFITGPWLALDPDLVSLRHHPRFQALLNAAP